MHKVLLFILVSFFSGVNLDTKVKLDTTYRDNSDNSITVTIVVTKGNLKDFARYTHELPSGVKAYSASPNFTFEGNRAKFIWVTMPADDVFTFVYTIVPDAGYTGEIQINGIFSYISNNERQFASTPATKMTLDEGKLASAAPAADIVVTAPSKYKVSCIRSVQREGIEQTVNISFSKGFLAQMGKVEEVIPKGYEAKVLEASGSVFQFAEGKASFMWMNLPMDESLTLSYRLVPKAGENPVAGQSITGSCSFAEDGIVYSVNTTDETPQVFAEEVPSIVSNDVKPEPVAPVKPIAEEVMVVSSEDSKNIAPSVTGLEYKVQIAAAKKRVEEQTYFKKYQLPYEVQYEAHDGWNKYVLGHFSHYKEARSEKEKVAKIVNGAFITAYNNGKRITVQEALMVAGAAMIN